MARKRANVKRGLLEAAIEEVEKRGSLTTRRLLWARTAKQYNASKGKLDLPISAATVMTHVKKWGIHVVTPPAKKGRPPSNGNGIENRIFLDLTDWEEKDIETGLHIGGTTKSRWVIACDNYQWILAKQVEGNQAFQRARYIAAFRQLLPAADEYTGNIAKKVADELHARIGGDPLALRPGSLAEQGRQIDTYFKVNYFLDSGIKERVFPGDSDQEVAVHPTVAA
jgi:hypothetical protein